MCLCDFNLTALRYRASQKKSPLVTEMDPSLTYCMSRTKTRPLLFSLRRVKWSEGQGQNSTIYWQNKVTFLMSQL